MGFKLYVSDVGVKINSVSYDFDHVNSIEIEDPEVTTLTRGANGQNKEGIVYKEGVRDPKVWTVPIMNMSSDLKSVLDSAYDNETRMDVYCIDRKTGSSKMLKNAVLRVRPKQLTIDETADSMAVTLSFAGYDDVEVYKA